VTRVVRHSGDATTYLVVAGRMDGNAPVVDMNSTCAGVAGTWVSTRTPAEMTVAQQRQSDRHAAAPA
jgi:hypothetical protein